MWTRVSAASLVAMVVVQATARAQQGIWVPSQQRQEYVAAARPVLKETNGVASILRRLPPVAPEPRHKAEPGLRIEPDPSGMWQEDGQSLIVNVNGQEYRVIKSEDSPAAGSSGMPVGGSVSGRLSNNGRPLAGCQVALVRIEKAWNGFRVVTATDSQLPMTVTDGAGRYYFANVPAGLYKLKWRPGPDEGWIRRAEVRPDVRVRPNEMSNVDEIRVALRTIN